MDNSASGALYEGLAVAIDSTGNAFLYAANFASGKVEVYDGTFQPAAGLPADAFIVNRNGRYARGAPELMTPKGDIQAERAE